MRRFWWGLLPLMAIIALVVPGGAARAASTNYVALGDSFSSGLGTGRYDINTSCRRSSLAFPALVAAAKGYALNFQACSGATTTDVIKKQVAALSSATNLVTVTAGGNDAGFSYLLFDCTATNCLPALNRTLKSMTATLPAKLDAMNRQIKRRAPNAKVIVLGYPRLFSGTCSATVGISSAEAAAANHWSDTIDRVTKTEAAKYPGFTYKSAIAQFTHHGVCAANAWVNGANLGASSDESYHPTAAGQSRGYAPLVREVTG